MIRFLADEDFNHAILRGVALTLPAFDVVSVHDVGLSGHHDTVLLEWAARENRVLLTHDARTMKDFAYDRVLNRVTMPGVFVVPQDVAIGIAVDQIATIAGASLDGEWEGQVRYLPL
jgi:hypothetical protein